MLDGGNYHAAIGLKWYLFHVIIVIVSNIQGLIIMPFCLNKRGLCLGLKSGLSGPIVHSLYDMSSQFIKYYTHTVWVA